MLRALVWKEWRQLRALRWAGLALAAVLPAAFLLGAEAGKRGLLFASVSATATRTILLEVLPVAYALALWPLLALLLVSQAFAGDRAAGVEAFLLERPVRRGWTWLARLVASFGSTLVVAAGSAAIATALVFSQGPTADTGALCGGSAIGGAILVGLATVGAMAAASVVPSPMTALLLALILGAAPLGVALGLFAKFPAAVYRGFPLGLAVSFILPVAFVLASWLASCRGEPAGRGRPKRFGIVLGAGFATTLLAFFLTAPTTLRLEARRLERGATVHPSPSGKTAVVVTLGTSNLPSAWIVDPSAGRLLRFLPPPVDSVTFAPDGRVAVVTGAQPFGAVARTPEMRFFGATGEPTGRAVGFSDEPGWWAASWSGSTVAVPVFRDRRMGLALVDSVSGATRTLDIWRPWWTWSIVGPTASGDLFVALGPDDAGSEGGGAAREAPARRSVPYDVFHLDVRKGHLAAKPLLHDAGLPWKASRRLSPSGRFWLVDRAAERCETRPLLDLEAGRETGPATPGGTRVWLASDTLAWTDTSGEVTWLLVARPGEDPMPLRGWRKALVSLEPSPDSALLLVTTRPPRADEVSASGRCPSFLTSSLSALAPEGVVPETRIFDLARSSWIEVAPWEPAEGASSDFHRTWAGPRTLARTGPGFLALEDIDRPGVLREVIGHPTE